VAKSTVKASTGVVIGLTEKVPIQVLLVDDETAFLKIAKECLEIEGPFQVETAVSVEEAMEKMKKKKYDAIVCDYVMPGKNGLQFLKELRDCGNKIPFIMFTGKGREEVAVKALNIGADRYFNKIGDPETVFGELAHGISQVVESKMAEEALMESRNYLETILNSIFTGVVVIDGETHKIVDANPNALETIGTSREHVIGKICHKFICPAEKGRCPISDLGQTVDKSERVLLRVDGRKIPILKSVKTITWRGHKYLIESFIGITERKQTEQVVQESQEKFKRLFMDNPEAAVYVDPDFHILDVNPCFTKLFGYSLEEIKGKPIDDVVVPKDKIDEAEMLNRKAFEGPFYHETVRKKKDGSLIQVSISIAPIRFEGKLVGTVGLYRDITERKRYEESLSALNAYGKNLNTAKIMEEIYRLTLDAMERTLGFEYAVFMVVNKNTLCVVDYRGYPEPFSFKLPLNEKRGVTVKAAKTGKSILVPDVRRDGDYVEFMSGIRSELAVPIKIGSRVFGVLNVESKTLGGFNERDQKLLEVLASHAATAMSNLEYAQNLETYAREIRESQERFERLFMNNPEAAVYMNSDFHIMDINPRFTQLFGYSLKEIKGKHINDIIVPEDNMEEGRMLDKKAEKGYVYYDSVRKRKDGSLVPVSISAAPITIEGKLVGVVGLYKDISDLKKVEKELRDTLEKLRVVGRLTRHDVRNKLSVVAGNAYLAKKKLAGDNEALKYLEEIEYAVRQTERIFDFAKTYEMLGVEELTYMNVEKTVQEAVSLFSDLKGAKVVNDCCGLTVLADSLLRQIFYNLIDNSLKYGERVKKITVHYEKIGRNQLKLIYEDDGVGIPKNEKEMIFKEGYGKGTGYGLYLIRKICEVYGWTIQETSEHGKGAQFTMTLPKINKSGKINWELH
jgi:PAS domain S-box-containing protein